MANMFDENGNYNKTEWKPGDRITAGKLNKIEESLEAINNNDIERHKEADERLDALEEQNEAVEERFDELEDLVADNKSEVDTAIYEVHSKMDRLEQEMNDGIDTVEAIAHTVDDKIAEADASMKAQVNQGKTDMEAMVAEVEGELDSINSQLEHNEIDKISKNTFMVNVKDFGAKGDGVTDDTQAFKDTVAYVNKFFLDTNYQTLLEIFIPAGVYIITDTINFTPPFGTSSSNGQKTSFNVRGSGRQSSKIHFNGVDSPCFKFTKCQVLLSDFMINCINSVKGTGITLGESYQRDSDDNIMTVVNHSTLQRLWILGSPTAVEVRYCFDTSFYDCYFSSVRKYNNVDNNSAVFNILPLEDEMSNNLNFVRCHFEGTEAHSTQLKIVGSSNNMYHHTMTFTSCHFETRNFSTKQFYLEYCKGMTFNNCVFVRNKNIDNDDTKEESPCIIKNSYHIEFNNCNFNAANNNKYKPYIELHGSVPSLCLINTLMNTTGKYDLNSYINYENLSDFEKDSGSWLINIYRGYNIPSLNFGFNRVSSLTQNYRRFENTFEIIDELDASVFKHNADTTNTKFNSSDVNYFSMNSIGSFSAHTYKSTNKKSIESNSSSQFDVTTSNASKRGVYMVIMDVTAPTYALVFFDGTNLHQINCGTQTIVSNDAPESTSSSKMYIYLTGKNITVMNTFSSTRNVMIIPFVF